MRKERKNKQTQQKSNHKLGIIVPYRDRPQQLKRFVTHMENYLEEYDYQIFVIEQGDDKSFNRGKLLNVGHEIASKNGCDYFAFHDVDMLPEDVDYSYTDKPLHLATHLQEHDYETTYFDYFGGVTLFNREDFETINGYSNEYWGWGFEDDDLLVRCHQKNLPLDLDVSGSGNIKEQDVFRFNGNKSYIKLTSLEKSTLLEDDFTISVLVKPQDIFISPNENYDEYPIISIPGYNIGLSYNSFRRFICQIYDEDKKSYSISTDILGERWVHLSMVYDEGESISFYVDGELVEKIELDTSILKLNSDHIFIGATSDHKTNRNFFHGLISNVEIYDTSLTEKEIKCIHDNPKKYKIRNFDDFKSSGFLFCQVLPELSNNERGIDLANEHKVEIFNVDIEKINQSYTTFLPKPYRRNGRFTSLKHKSNSSSGYRWIHKETRQNQIKYYNEVRSDFIDFHIDGLNTLHYEIIENEYVSDRTTKIKVNI